MNNRNVSFLLTGLALAILSALLRFWAFTQTPFATGWDSYFYLVQLKSLEETGRMHSPEASLIYPYLRLFYWLTGDYVLGMKAGVAVLSGIWVAVVYGSTAFRPSGEKAFMPFVVVESALKGAIPDGLKAVLPVGIALFSPQFTYFAAQYPKNLLGLIFFGLFVNSLQRQVAERSEIRGLRTSHLGFRTHLLPAFWLILNYFGHRMTFGLAVVYLVLHLLFQIKQFTAARVKKALLLSVAAAGLFLVAGQIFPGLAHWADSGRLQGVVSVVPQFAPWSFVQTFGFQRISAFWLFEITAVTVLFLWLLFRAFQQHDRERLPLLILCVLLIFPFLEWSVTGISWRFWMVFPLLVPIASPKCEVDSAKSVTSAKSIVRSPKSAFPGWKMESGTAGMWLCCLALFVAAFFSWKSYRPALHDPDYVQFQRITEHVQQYFNGVSAPDVKSPFRLERPGDLKRPGDLTPGPELVIAHNALAEYFTFSTGTDAMPWLPEYAIDSSRLWRIAAGVRLPTLQYFSGKENELKIKNLGGNYYLLPEYIWQQALVRARAERDSDFLETAESWRNPWKMRPGWLLRKRR